MSSQMIANARATVESAVVEGLAAAQGEIDAARMGRELPLPRFVSGLATQPQALPRQALGFASRCR